MKIFFQHNLCMLCRTGFCCIFPPIFPPSTFFPPSLPRSATSNLNSNFPLQLNLLLAVFNMLPIPPLDGGNVLAGVLPEPMAVSYDRFIRPYGFVILIVLMATGWLSRLIGPPFGFLMGMLLP